VQVCAFLLLYATYITERILNLRFLERAVARSKI